MHSIKLACFKIIVAGFKLKAKGTSNSEEQSSDRCGATALSCTLTASQGRKIRYFMAKFTIYILNPIFFPINEVVINAFAFKNIQA